MLLPLLTMDTHAPSTIAGALRLAADHFDKQSKMEAYRNDPALWFKDRKGGHFWSKQKDLCDSIVVNKYTAVKSGHSTGKTRWASEIVQWWIDTHIDELDETLVITTGPTFQQVVGVLWEYIRKGHRDLGMVGEINERAEWRAGTPRMIVGQGVKPADGNSTAMQGRHYKYTLVIIDEACHDDQTDVLTRAGWKRWADVTMDDEFMTMNPDTHEACYQRPERLVAYDYSGPMHTYEAKGMNYSVTPNHDMLYKQRGTGAWVKKQSQKIGTWSNKYLKKVIDWAAPEDPALSDSWLALLGWFGAEGSINKAVNAVTISQSEGREDYEKIFKLAEDCGFRPSRIKNAILISSTKLAQYLNQFGRTQETRRVPSFVREASARQIGVYLDAYAAGDGYKRPSGEIIYTSCEDMANDLQELILKTGVPSVIRKRKLEGVGQWFAREERFITSTRDGFVVTRPDKATEAKMYNTKQTVTDYEGKVYCATVPNHLLFTRRNGYTMWSGNCGVPKEIFQVIDAIVISEESRVVAVGNPTDPNTYFGDIFLSNSGRGIDSWNKMTISVLDNPNFTGEDCPEDIKKNLAGEFNVNKWKEEYGADSNEFKFRVLGEFPDSADDALFPLHLLYEAVDRETVPAVNASRWLGVDLARFKDHSAIVMNEGGKITVEDMWQGLTTFQSAERIHTKAVELGASEVRVDSLGPEGRGVLDELAVLAINYSYKIVHMDGAAASPDNKRFLNARAWWHYTVKMLMVNQQLDLPFGETGTPAAKLFDEMRNIKYKYAHGGVGGLQIESKEEMRKRGIKSPDISDAVCYACAPSVLADPLGSFDHGDTFSTIPDDILEELQDLDWAISPV